MNRMNSSVIWIAFIAIALLARFQAQVVQPFAIRFQTNQKGGITRVANTALTCNLATNGCTAATSYSTVS